MSIKDFVDLVQNLAVIAASAVAVYGIGAWRREFIGKRNLEFAEEVLALFYQARDAIRDMRSPFSFGGEGATRRAEATETADEKQRLDSAFVLIERYKRHAELFTSLQTVRYRFMARFGRGVAEPFQELTVVVNDLIGAAYEMGEIARHRARFRSPEKEEEYDQYVKSVYKRYYAGARDDPTAAKVDDAVARIERICEPVIARRGR